MTDQQLQQFEKIKAMDKLFLNASEVAPVLGSGEDDLRGAARARPDLLGFPVVCIGSRVKIPRKPFIDFLEKLPPKCSRECELQGIFLDGVSG